MDVRTLDNFKLDLAYKKLGFGVQTTSTNKAGYEEAITSPIPIYDKDIWAEASKIPLIAQEVSNLIVKVTNAVLTEDITVAEHTVFLSDIKDFIPPTFGASYVVKVLDSEDRQVFAGQTNFYFDYSSGTLIFPLGSASYNGFTPPFKITAYKYIGVKGLVLEEGGGGGGGYSLTTYEHIESNVSNSERRIFYMPIGYSGYIKGIKVTGNEFTGNFSLRIFTKHPDNGGTYVYHSGTVNNVLWDIMDIPFTDESGERTVCVILDNAGVASNFLIQIYMSKG